MILALMSVMLAFVLTMLVLVMVLPGRQIVLLKPRLQVGLVLVLAVLE